MYLVRASYIKKNQNSFFLINFMKITFVYVILFLFIQGGSSIMMCLVNGEMSAQLGYTSDHSYMKIQDVGIK